MKTIKIQCQDCRSEDVVRYQKTRWNFATQEWEIVKPHETLIVKCETCGLGAPPTIYKIDIEPRLACQSCGGTLRHEEEAGQARELIGIEDGVLKISGAISEHFYDEATKEKLVCRECQGGFPLPENIEYV